MSGVAREIASSRDEIVRRWTADASRLASARGLPHPELQNVMPRFVDALADDRDPPADRSAERTELIERHAAARLRQGFDVSEVVEELAILGRAISGLWADRPSTEQPPPEEVAALFAELQSRGGQVLQLFHEHLQRDAQVEKRFLRQLGDLAREAVETDDTSRDERLREMLEVVMGAMGAQSIALLLYDPATDELVTSSVAGLASDQLARFVTSRSPLTFAGKVAAMKEVPTAIADAETTTLEVSDALRHSGIHALMGVRLPPSEQLVGVLYVGLRQVREFTARERYLIEVFGERLVLHLQIVRLLRERNAQLDALRVERGIRERFVSVLAHDLRGPLSVAKLGAQLLIRDPDRSRADAPVKILRSVERMDRMIRDLLDANRLRAGEPLPLSVSEADFAEVARDAVQELAELHGDRFELRASSPVPGYADVDLLHRALWNLGMNAVKYGRVDARIVVNVEPRGSGVRISVHNEGNPISAADQQMLFEPFRRLQSAQQSGQTGWGLGLALVRGAAVAHGGIARVESSPERGTTFILDLPVDARRAAREGIYAGSPVHA